HRLRGRTARARRAESSPGPPFPRPARGEAPLPSARSRPGTPPTCPGASPPALFPTPGARHPAGGRPRRCAGPPPGARSDPPRRGRSDARGPAGAVEPEGGAPVVEQPVNADLPPFLEGGPLVVAARNAQEVVRPERHVRVAARGC